MIPKTILVADDLKTNRKMLQSILEKEGYLTIGAEKGYECIQLALDKRPNLILLDIRMPDINGIDVCRRLRGDSCMDAVQIIFVTAATDDRTLSQAFDAGGYDYIRKPVNRIELVKRIQAAFVHEKLIEKQQEENKLRSVLSMSGTVCHELNQPLQYISGNCQLLMMDLEKGSTAFQRVEKMKKQIDRMGSITKRLMQVSRVDAYTYLGETQILSIGR